MKLTQYDYNYGAYENVKANIMADRLAKNRWGAKFARLYKRHMNASDYGSIGTYDFTEGMRASVLTLTESHSDLDKAIAFKQKLLDNLQVDTGSGFSIDGVMQESYASVLLESVPGVTFSGIPTSEVLGVHFSLSLSDDQNSSWFYSSGVDDSTTCVDYESGELTGERHDDILTTRGVEDRSNVAFNPNQDTLFSDMWAEMIVFLGLISEDEMPLFLGTRTSVVVSLSSLFAFLDERIEILADTIDTLENGEDRIGDDLELIDHLDLGDTLYEEITRPHKIKRVWFKFEKEITATLYDDLGIPVSDPDYEWWNEEQFDDIRKNVKDFQNYCIVDGTTV